VAQPEVAAEAVTIPSATPVVIALDTTSSVPGNGHAAHESVGLEAGLTTLGLTRHIRDDQLDGPDLDDAWAGLLAADPTLDADAGSDEVPPDEWRALAASLGPDVAQPVAAPTATPLPGAASAVPAATQPAVDANTARPNPPVAWPAPLAEAPAMSPAWQLTAPDGSAQPAGWRPYGSVYQTPSAVGASGANLPHPAMLSGMPGGTSGATALGAGAATGAHLPAGVRPCHNCALPVSAQARFCRRCGQSQV